MSKKKYGVPKHRNPPLPPVARVTFDEQPKDDHTFKCDCHYPCDNYPHCGGHKITFDEQPEDGCKCQRCGKLYKVDVMIPDHLWDIIKPAGKENGAGLLCGACILQKLEDLRGVFEPGMAGFDAFNLSIIEPEAAGQEQEDDLIEIVRLAYHALGKIRSEPTMSGTRYFPIPKEFGVIALEFHEKLDAFCGKHKHLVDKITRKP